MYQLHLTGMLYIIKMRRGSYKTKPDGDLCLMEWSKGRAISITTISQVSYRRGKKPLHAQNIKTKSCLFLDALHFCHLSKNWVPLFLHTPSLPWFQVKYWKKTFLIAFCQFLSKILPAVPIFGNTITTYFRKLIWLKSFR